MGGVESDFFRHRCAGGSYPLGTGVGLGLCPAATQQLSTRSGLSRISIVYGPWKISNPSPKFQSCFLLMKYRKEK